MIDDYPKNRLAQLPKGVEYEFKKFYYETAHATRSDPGRLEGPGPGLADSVRLRRPYQGYELTTDGLDEYPGFSPAIGAPSIAATPSASSRASKLNSPASRAVVYGGLVTAQEAYELTTRGGATDFIGDRCV
jgi:hypothetical protein